MTEKPVAISSPSTADFASPPAVASSNRLALLGRRWRVPLLVWIVWRLGLIPVSLWAGTTFPLDPRPDLPFFIPPLPDNLAERTVGIWAHWDGQFFLHIAQYGYNGGDYSQSFFPLYPLLVRLVAVGLGGNYGLAGVLLSAGLALVAFGLLYELVRDDFRPRVASWAVIALAAYPTSYYLAACYSEGLFLALTLGAFLAARRYSNWLVAGLLVGLATLTRNMGLALLLPLGWEWLRQHRAALWPVSSPLSLKARLQKLQILPTAFFVSIPLVMLGAWIAFNGVALGQPFGFLTVNERWGRQSAWPWQTTGRVIELILQGRLFDPHDVNLYDLPDWLFVVGLWLVSAWLVWRGRFPVSYFLYFGVSILLPMFAPHPEEPLYSFPRLSLLSFPAFVLLALPTGRGRILTYIYVGLGVLLMVFLFARFSNWYWVA